MTPYEREFVVTTDDTDQIVTLDFPGRCTITRIAALNLDNGEDVSVTFYNRKFDSYNVTIANVYDDGNGKTMFVFARGLALKVGDRIEVASVKDAAGVDITEYIGNHRITRIGDVPNARDKVYMTDTDYTVDGYGGNAALAVDTDEYDLYKVATLTGSGVQTATNEIVYVNLDPLGNINKGVTRKIYAKFAAAGSYKVVLRAKITVAEGG